MTELPQAPAMMEPQGIGGWLILPVIGTLLLPLIMAYAAFQDAVDLLKASLSTAPAAFIAVRFLCNFSLGIAWIFAVVLLFRHKRWYPRFFVGLLAIMLIEKVLDLAVTAMAFDIRLDSSDVRSTLRFAIGLAIWGPYMHKSVRVKNTFVAD
jgi:hypothetical protein